MRPGVTLMRFSRLQARLAEEHHTQGILCSALKTTLRQREAALNRLHPPKCGLQQTSPSLLFPAKHNFTKKQGKWVHLDTEA